MIHPSADPHEVCEDVDELAPCCDVPAVEDVVCDDGNEPAFDDGFGESWNCRTRQGGGWAMLNIVDPRQQEGAEPYATWGRPDGSSAACGLGGRLLWATAAASEGACLVGCWHADGSPWPDCPHSTTEACE